MSMPPDGYEGDGFDTNGNDQVVDLFEFLDNPDANAAAVDIGSVISLFDRIDVPDSKNNAERVKRIGTMIFGLLQTSSDSRGDMQKLASLLIRDRTRQAEVLPLHSEFMTALSFPDSEKPSITFEQSPSDEDFATLLKKSEKPGRLKFLHRPNSWIAKSSLEPYESDRIALLSVTMSTSPAEGTAESSAQLVYRKTGFNDSMNNLIKLREVRDVIETFPFSFVTKEGNFREVQRKPYLTDDGNAGLHMTFGNGLEATIEMEASGITIACKFDKSTNRDITNAEDEQARDEIFAKYAGLQWEFATQVAPYLLEKLAQPLISGRTDHQRVFTLEKSKRYTEQEEEMLRFMRRDLEHAAEVPEVLKDPRHIELYRSVIQEKPETTFDMIGGLDEAVLRTQRAVRKARNPELYRKAGIKPKSTVLLAGPPGCGKTMLAEAAANLTDSIFLSARGSDIMSMWAGEAEKNVAALFEMVQLVGTEKPVVLLLDEIEGLAPSRVNNNMMEFERKITAEFLAMLNQEYPNCVIIAATNDPSHVDAAVLRSGRFNDIILIPKPDRDGRKHILENWIGHFKNEAEIPVLADDIDTDQLAQASDSLSGSDLKTMIESAITDVTDEAIEADSELQPVTMERLLAKIKDITKQNETRTGQYL